MGRTFSDEEIAHAVAAHADAEGRFLLWRVAAALRGTTAMLKQRLASHALLSLLQQMNPAAADWARARVLARKAHTRHEPIIKDFCGTAPCAERPSTALAGSENRIRAMMERAANGQSVFNPKDATESTGPSVAPEDAPSVARTTRPPPR